MGVIAGVAMGTVFLADFAWVGSTVVGGCSVNEKSWVGNGWVHRDLRKPWVGLGKPAGQPPEWDTLHVWPTIRRPAEIALGIAWRMAKQEPPAVVLTQGRMGGRQGEGFRPEQQRLLLIKSPVDYRAAARLRRQEAVATLAPGYLEVRVSHLRTWVQVLVDHTNDCSQSAGCIILPEPTLEWQIDISVGPELCINTPYK